jgi:hypothetical protein
MGHAPGGQTSQPRHVGRQNVAVTLDAELKPTAHVQEEHQDRRPDQMLAIVDDQVRVARIRRRVERRAEPREEMTDRTRQNPP